MHGGLRRALLLLLAVELKVNKRLPAAGGGAGGLNKAKSKRKSAFDFDQKMVTYNC